MSDTEPKTPHAKADGDADNGANMFTPKEWDVLKKAWFCLEDPPKVSLATTAASVAVFAFLPILLSLPSLTTQVDMAKLQAACGFNTLKTTSNTWGKVRNKLASAGGVPNGQSLFLSFFPVSL